MFRKFLFFLALVLLRLLAPDPVRGVTNSLTYTDLTSATQTNRPLSFARTFACGEIPNYARPAINGTPATTWQMTAQNRCPDGSLKFALVATNTNLSANGNAVVTFANATNPSSAGDGTATAAAGLSKSAILALTTWDAQIELTQSAVTKTINARTMLTALAVASKQVRFLEQGPSKTTVLIEDLTTARSQDIGWGATTPIHPRFILSFFAGGAIKVEFILENPWTYLSVPQTYDITLKTGTSVGSFSTVYSKSAHVHYPSARWRKVFWIGTPPGAVKEDHNKDYLISTKVIPNYNGARTVTSAGVTDELTGADDALSKIDLYNGTDTNTAQFDPGDTGPFSIPAIANYMGSSGGHSYVGVFPRWQVRWLYTMDPRLLSEMLAIGDTSGSWPTHWRDSSTTNYFDGAHTVLAFGLPVSADAFYWSLNGITQFMCTTQSDCQASGQPQPDTAHQPQLAFLPYLITGDLYYLEELQFWASWTQISSANQCDYVWYCRGGALAVLPAGPEIRARAWGSRTYAHAAWASIDGTPEKTYYTEKLYNNIAAWEGYLAITSTAFNGNTAWTYGNTVMHANYSSGADHIDGPNPLNNISDSDYNFGATQGAGYVNGTAGHAATIGSPWMANYQYISWGHQEELGYPLTALRKKAMTFPIGLVKDPASNPYTFQIYQLPVKRLNPGQGPCTSGTNCPVGSMYGFYRDWPTMQADLDSATQADATGDFSYATINRLLNGACYDKTHNYCGIARSALSFGTDVSMTASDSSTITGQQAYDWVNTQIKAFTFNAVVYDAQYEDNPTWDIAPRTLTSSPNAPRLTITGRSRVTGKTRVP